MTKIYSGWWFGNTLGYGDGRQAAAGEVHTVDGTPQCCKFGLHASPRILDALDYTNKLTVWRVNVWGDVDVGNGKIAGTHRQYLWKVDCEDLLWEFSRRCALDVVHLWDAPDVAVRYLKTGDNTLRDAARDAARAAARDSAWVAAWGAARAAARAAAGAAAREAAREAARDAAGDSAGDSVWAAARAAARAAAGAAAREAAREAARAAARAAARDAAAWVAARAAQNRRLTSMVLSKHKKEQNNETIQAYN